MPIKLIRIDALPRRPSSPRRCSKKLWNVGCGRRVELVTRQLYGDSAVLRRRVRHHAPPRLIDAFVHKSDESGRADRGLQQGGAHRDGRPHLCLVGTLELGETQRVTTSRPETDRTKPCVQVGTATRWFLSDLFGALHSGQGARRHPWQHTADIKESTCSARSMGSSAFNPG